MAKKTVVTTETREVDGASEGGDKRGDEIPLTAEGESVESDLVAELLAAGLEEDITYTVKCVSPATKAGYCTKYSRGELSLDRIREDWGSGTYTITAMDSQNHYRRRVTQKIVESAKPPNMPTSQTTQLAEMAQILRTNQPAVPGGTDMTAVLVAMMKSQGDMLTAILTRPAPPPTPAPDPLAMIAALKDIMKPEKSETSGVDMLLKGLELGKELGGGSEWTDVFSKGLDTVVPLLGEAVRGGGSPAPNAARPIQRRPIPPRPQAQLPAAAGSAPGQNGNISDASTGGANIQGSNGEGESVLLKKIEWLKRQAAVLAHQAARDKDPALYAELFLDNLPEQASHGFVITLEDIHEQMSKPNAVAALGQLHPPVLEHPEWFEEFRKACLDLIVDEGDEDAPAGASDIATPSAEGEAHA
jgi:hypothetical protein